MLHNIRGTSTCLARLTHPVGFVMATALFAGCVTESDALVRISVSPNPATVLTNGSVQFTATGRSNDGETRSISPAWSVANGGGTITSSGVFTAGSVPGTFTSTVHAKLEGITGKATVQVVSPDGGGGGPTYSCPTVYSWDGAQWRIDSGTFGGAIAQGLTRTDIDNLEHAVAVDGVVTLNVRSELDETDYIDALALLAIDHERGTTVAPASDGRIFGLGRLSAPSSATDSRGHDILTRIVGADGVNWESDLDVRDTSDVTALSDAVEIRFPRARHARSARLLITSRNTSWGSEMLRTFLTAHGSGLSGWYARIDGDSTSARESGAALAQTALLRVSLWTASGWQPQGLIWEVGPEVLKHQVVPLDLRDAAPGDIRVRLETPPSFWRIDRVAIAFESRPFTVTTVKAADSVLANVDGRMQTLATGHGFQLAFAVPEPPAGKQRTYMLSSTGWYRINLPALGEPNREYLRRIAAGPLAMRRMTVELRNRLIRRAQQEGGT
ncbi:MAG: hypothetical protein FIB01_05490 [Gemmatimonadetes bacterium]|nr:hypothetical protein [Gemmatimonadota bacterium]